MIRLGFVFLLVMVGLMSCHKARDNYNAAIPSPNSKLELHFNLYDGEPYYLVYAGDDIVVDWSWMGFTGDAPGSFREEMKVSRTVTGAGTEEDGLQLLSGEQFNRLKVYLHKKDNQEPAFAIVFCVYDECLVFWYELYGAMNGELPDLKESSELDLHSSSQAWSLIDTLAMNDTLMLPVSFLSDKGIQLSIAEMENENLTGSYLIQRNIGLPEFDLQLKLTDNNYSFAGQAATFITTKKIIRIHRNNH
jgi:alpha-glucosidase